MDINREIITAMKLIFFQIFLGGNDRTVCWYKQYLGLC